MTISENKGQVILGIDPGTNILGFSVISGVKNTIKISTCGIVKLKSGDAHFDKLNEIYNRISQLIVDHRPQAMAIEAPFYGKNIQSMLKLGRAQGAAILAGTQGGLEIFEYSPRRIKQAITGNGNASKEQVARMLQSLYQMPFKSTHLDETDAIAVAVCHFFEGRPQPGAAGKVKDWSEFLKNNPDRKAL